MLLDPIAHRRSTAQDPADTSDIPGKDASEPLPVG